MVELFRNPRINWLKAKGKFIAATIFLLLLGALSVQIQGFNLGVDFTGGTIVTVRFTGNAPEIEQIRAAIGEAGIDPSKLTIQQGRGTVRVQDGGTISGENDFIIRTPQTGSESERRVDEDKRTIIRALRRFNTDSGQSANKVNINIIDEAGVEQELRQMDPLQVGQQAMQASENPYVQSARQVIQWRDQQPNRFVADDGALDSLQIAITGPQSYDGNAIKNAIKERFYAGKIDLNLSGQSEIEDALERINPLGSGNYAAIAKAIADYRKSQGDVIPDLSQVQGPEITPDVLSKLDPYFQAGGFSVISAEVVGAVVGADLRNRAIYVTLAALAGMLFYIAFRFEWIYGVAAVLAVFHDVMVTLGFFSLFQWEINLTVVAALLTLVGYSMNDTIVIFDRIRENIRLRRRDRLAQLANDSINQTLSRTVMTSGLTFISVVAIVLFGGDVLRGFALALTIGIIVGSYSTIAIASPLMLWWEYITSGRNKPKASGERTRADERTLARV
jgi:preprotein translocase subunit SecF